MPESLRFWSNAAVNFVSRSCITIFTPRPATSTCLRNASACYVTQALFGWKVDGEMKTRRVSTWRKTNRYRSRQPLMVSTRLA